tara:strand:+ start:2551 stop:3288 length:738 start_codon:yes stop_codon:yes gene_type:complete
MNSNDFISTNQLLADILINVNDEDYKQHGFTKGFYVSAIQQALEEMSFDTFFDEQTMDVDIPSNFRIRMPKNIFNIREMYVHKGTCCSPRSSAIVHWKRLYNNKGGDGSQYTAKRKNEGSDPIYRPKLTISGIDGAAIYANIQNGTIMLSSNVSGYSKLRIIANGMGVEIGDEPVVPRFLRQVTIDWVTERTFRALAAKDMRLRNLWSDSSMKLQQSQLKAERRIKGMDTWERDSMREYLGRLNY